MPASVTSRNGIPLTTPARTIGDLQRATKLKSGSGAIAAWELRRAIRQAEALGLPTGAEAATEGTRSDLELEFLGLCREHGLPEPEVNARIGRLEVDFLWRDRRLVVETDGYRYHRGRASFERDRTRDFELRFLDFDVIRVSQLQVAAEPDRIATILQTSLRARGRPEV